MTKNYIQKIISIFLILFICGGAHAATWQETLEGRFDIVETFDQLEPWYGTKYPGVVNEIGNPELMPMKKDGTPSMWGTYSQYYSGPNQHLEDWIGDHGEYNWRSNASACINYPPLYCGTDLDTVKGYGSERLGTYFGNGTPESGYHDIHVFFMLRFHDGFYEIVNGTDDEFVWGPVVKLFDCCSGFEHIRSHGVDGEGCHTQAEHEYGTSYILWTNGGGGMSRPKQLYFNDNVAVDYWGGENECWKYVRERRGTMHRETNFAAEYLASKWIGVEYHLNLGTLNNSDGRLEFWLYNESGYMIGYYDSGPALMQTLLPYNYNKIVFGGNYQCAGDTSCPGETRWYFDDFIIDGERIGLDYFEIMNGTYVPEDPDEPNESNGSLSSGINHGVQIPNNPVTITEVYDRDMRVGETIFVDCNATDLDCDIVTYSCNRTDLFTNFQPINGQGNFIATDNGVYYVNFGVSDGWGSTNNNTMVITVSGGVVTPPDPINLEYIVGNWKGSIHRLLSFADLGYIHRTLF